MLRLAFAIGALLILSLVFYLASRWLELRKHAAGDTREEPLPYIPAMLMTRAEIDFFKTIRRAVGDSAIVFVQVPLGSILSISPGASDWQKWRNKVDRKIVDFVLCHPVTLATMVVIELDDRSHLRESRKQRDEFVERALATARVRLVRIPSSWSGWSVEKLRSHLIVE